MKIEISYEDIKGLISERYGIPKNLIVLCCDENEDTYFIVDIPVDYGHIRFFPNIKEIV